MNKNSKPFIKATLEDNGVAFSADASLADAIALCSAIIVGISQMIGVDTNVFCETLKQGKSLIQIYDFANSLKRRKGED